MNGNPPGTTATRTKTSVHAQVPAQRLRVQGLRVRHRAAVLWTTSRSFLIRGRAAGPGLSWTFLLLTGGPDSAAANAYAIPNMARAWSSVAKETVTMRRSRYNLQESA